MPLLTISASDRHDLGTWLTRIAQHGEDDALPYFCDWLEERGAGDVVGLISAYLRRSWIASEAAKIIIPPGPGRDLGFPITPVVDAMAGRVANPSIARAIREVRMHFRESLMCLRTHGQVTHHYDRGMTPRHSRHISSRSDPPWVPWRVQRDYQNTTGRFSTEPVWKFAGIATAAATHIMLVRCDHPPHPQPHHVLATTAEVPDRQRMWSYTDVACHAAPYTWWLGSTQRDQVWWIGRCAACGIVHWWTDAGRALEQDPEMLHGI